MCAYMADAPALEGALGREVPLVGERLASALTWAPEVSASGCVCSRGNRAHKWRMVYQTIYYAIRQGIAPAAPAAPAEKGNSKT